MFNCSMCGGYQFSRPMCPGGIAGDYVDPRCLDRCRCFDTNMEKAQLAFLYLGFFVGVMNGRKDLSWPKDPKDG